MKPLLKVGLILGAVLVVLTLALSMLFGITPTIQPRKTPAPEGFETTAFPPIQTLQSTDLFNVVNLNAQGDLFHPGFMKNQTVLYLSLSTSPYDAQYIFFNAKGTEIGRKVKTRTAFPVGNTIIDADGYYTVSSNAVGTKRPFADFDGVNLVSLDLLKELQSQSTYFRSIPYHDFPRDGEIYQNKINTYTFLLDGEWTRARAKHVEGTYIEWKTAPFPELTTQHNFPMPDATSGRSKLSENSPFFGGKYTVAMTWFDQQEYFRRRNPSIGSPTGMGRPEQWSGIGYYSVSANDQSIAFSIPNDTLVLSGSRNIRLKAMGYETLDFILITHYEQNKPRHYIISTKG